MNERLYSGWIKNWANGLVASAACLTWLSAGGTEPPPPPPSCDPSWMWGALPSSRQDQTPQDMYGPIADVGGKVFAIGVNASGAYALMGYDGSRQHWITYASGFMNGGVSAMATYGNTLYIGGTFQGFNNSSGGFVNANNVAALNIVNGQWTPIGTGTPVEQWGNHAAVQSMTVDSSGVLYAGLDQTAPADPSGLVGMLVKWDTVAQQWVSVGGGFHIDAYANYCGNPIVPQSPPNFGITALTASGTDIYVAGYFDLCGAGSVSTYHVARWISSSQSWVPIAPDRDWCYFYCFSDDPYIYSLLVANDKLYVAGDMLPNCNGTTPQGLAEFSLTGGGLYTPGDNLWGDFFTAGDGTTGYDPGVGYALVQRNCAVYLAGDFRSIGAVGGSSGVQAWGVAKQVSGVWEPLGAGLIYSGDRGLGSYLATDAAADTNHVYVQGLFDTAGSVAAQKIAVWQGPIAIEPPPQD